MQFSEAQQEWRPVPPWAAFLIRLGYNWPGGGSEQRKVALISMPCDSAAAGLIALGAMIRDFGSPNANDVDGHYAALLRYARQYLESCLSCNMRCHPESRGCGYAREATGRLRSLPRPHAGYLVSGETDFGEPRIAFVRDGVTYKPGPTHATKYYIDGEPPPELNNPEGILPEGTYARIVAGAQIIPDNLRKSYSGLCLAARVAGETATRNACASIRFRDPAGERGLETLLTVHGWSEARISRVVSFNSRIGRFDRNSGAPALVVADGDASFLKVLGRSEFQRTDVIGVIQRTVDREKLEDVGNRILGLRQWYEDDAETLGRLPATPRGIGVAILRRRPT